MEKSRTHALSMLPYVSVLLFLAGSRWRQTHRSANPVVRRDLASAAWTDAGMWANVLVQRRDDLPGGRVYVAYTIVRLRPVRAQVSRRAWYPSDCMRWTGGDTLVLQIAAGQGDSGAAPGPNGGIRLHWRRVSPEWSLNGEAAPAEAEGRMLGQAMPPTRSAFLERSLAD